MQLEILIAVLTGVMGVLAFQSNREKDVGVEAKWRGNVDAKLDLILQLQVEVHKLADTVGTFEGRIVTLENSAKACHRRLDDLSNINNINNKINLNKH